MCIQPHFLFPRAAIQRIRGMRTVIKLRLLLRKIGSALRHRLHLDVFSGLHLDESFGGGAVLAFGLPPHGSLHNCRIVIDRYGFSETAGEAPTAVANSMRIIQLVAPHAYLPFE